MEDKNFIVKTNQQDISSFSNFQDFRQEHIHIKNKVDFENKMITGYVELQFKVISNKNSSKLILDCKSLKINAVENMTSKKSLSWFIYDKYPAANALGTPLVIQLDKEHFQINEEFTLRISYSTLEDCEAILWFNKEQTHSKEHPFMFTQSEPILGRTLFPAQDSPSVKATVSVELTCPYPLIYAFSGVLKNTIKNELENEITYYYTQNIPVPTYLIAFACGHMEYGKISERCGIYTEKGLLEKALYEFADTEKFLKTAEDYINPYVWEVYNILVLPSPFPFGGMENPCLTFVTPSLLAGDRSLTNVIAHEIAHSWTGNLVTNKDWNNFWMNEGFTTFLERKISELINGEDLANLESQVGMIELKHDMESIGLEHTFCSLNPDLKDVDPNDAFSVVPYEKGFCLLKYLENLIGKENFQKIFRDYIKRFARKSVSYHDYINVFNENIKNLYSEKEADEILKIVDWEKWIFTCGEVHEHLDFPSKWIDIANNFGEKFLTGKAELINDQDVVEFKSWHTNVKLVFINYLHKNLKRITDQVYFILRDRLNLHQSYNVEVTFNWYELCLELKKEEIIPFVKSFLTSHGRMKYIKPIYYKYYELKRGEALKFFKENKHLYHSIPARIMQQKFDELESQAN